MSYGSIINFCVSAGSGMSGCSNAGKGFENQSLCSFSKQFKDSNRCTFEKFGEYCSCTVAQDHVNGKSINLVEVKGWDNNLPEVRTRFRKEKYPVPERFREVSDHTHGKPVGGPVPFDSRRIDSGHSLGERCDNKKCPLCSVLFSHDPDHNVGNPHNHNHSISPTVGKVSDVVEYKILKSRNNLQSVKEDPGHFAYYEEEYYDTDKTLEKCYFGDVQAHKIEHEFLHKLYSKEQEQDFIALHGRPWSYDPDHYVYKRREVRNNILLERAQVGLIVPINGKVNLYYDSEYHIFYCWEVKSQKFVDLKAKTVAHLRNDFDDWAKHVPESALPGKSTPDL